MDSSRADEDLAFMLQYENVAWYDAGAVRILDRRVYPAKIEFVTCRTHVRGHAGHPDMVTQSAGPYTAAGMGMALAAWECREKSQGGAAGLSAGGGRHALPTPGRRPRGAHAY